MPSEIYVLKFGKDIIGYNPATDVYRVTTLAELKIWDYHTDKEVLEHPKYSVEKLKKNEAKLILKKERECLRASELRSQVSKTWSIMQKLATLFSRWTK